MNRYQREKARMLAEIAGQPPRPAPMAPTGTNPTVCEPFKLHAVDCTTRPNCVRRRGCVDYAIARKWSAFSCNACPVREDRVSESSLRRESMAATVMPDARGDRG